MVRVSVLITIDHMKEQNRDEPLSVQAKVPPFCRRPLEKRCVMENNTGLKIFSVMCDTAALPQILIYYY